MAIIASITTLYSDKAKTLAIAPRTTTSAVTDINGVGLDSVLSTIQTNVNTLSSSYTTLNSTVNTLSSTVNTMNNSYMKFYSGTSAPADTSGKTVWYDTSNKVLKFYVNGTWMGLNTYQ